MPGDITYEFQSSLNSSSTDGVLTTNVWKSPTPLTTNSIHSTGASDGNWYWQVRAKDASGNYSAWSEIWQVTLDTNAPTTPEITGFLNPELACGAVTNAHSITVDWTDSVAGASGLAGYEYKINYPLTNGLGQGNFSDFVTASSRTGSLNEGVHTIQVRAKDMAGNYSAWSNECQITADWSAPVVAINAPLDNANVSSNVAIYGSVNDINLMRYWFVIQNASSTVVAGPGTVNTSTSFTNQLLLEWDTTLVPNGTYTIKLEARDLALNKGSLSSDWHTVIVNNQTPDEGDDDEDENNDDDEDGEEEYNPNKPDQYMKEWCKQGGWQEMTINGYHFKNQGECVSYYASGGKDFNPLENKVKVEKVKVEKVKDKK